MLSCTPMWRSLSLLLSFFLSSVLMTPMAQAQAVSLSAETTRLDLSGRMQWLKDDSARMGIGEVAASHDFKPLPGELNLGFTAAAIWLRVEVASSALIAQPSLLEVTNPMLDDVRLYTRASDGSFTEHRSGDHLARELWEMDYRQPVFRLDFDARAPQTLWLRLQSRQYMSAQLLLWQPDAFHQAVRTETLLYGLFFGVFLTILVLHLFFWHLTRDPLRGWYALYVASNALIVLYLEGYFQLYSQWNGKFLDPMFGVLLCSMIWSTTMFAVVQLDLGSLLPRMRRLLVNSSALLSMLFILLTLTLDYPTGVMPAQLTMLVWGMLLLALPLWLWWRGHAPARFFALAFSVFLAGCMLRLARSLGFLEPSPLTNYAYQIGSIIHMLMMSLVISGRHTATRLEKLANQVAVNKLLEEQITKRVVSLQQEISQREALEIELRQALVAEQQARQQQRDFVAMVSHEFRTPLAIINSSVHHVAQDLSAAQAKSLTRCDNIKNSVARMTVLMDDYLSLDRMEDDSHVMQFDACNLHELVSNVVADWPAGLIELSATDLPPTLLCDWKLVRVAVHNLVANGLRHSPAGVPLQIALSGQADGAVQIEIKDAGTGIPIDEIGRIFEKYFRGRGAMGEPGAGLGLYIVQHIARLHGGSVSAYSEPNQGSTFVLALPGTRVLTRRSTDRIGIKLTNP